MQWNRLFAPALWAPMLLLGCQDGPGGERSEEPASNEGDPNDAGCTDIDECLDDPCPAHTHCLNEPVAKSDYDQVWKAWDDAELYPTLRFTGVIANDVGVDLDLPVAKGSRVQAHVPNPDSPPRIEAPANGGLAELLTKTWSKAAFEEYAVARGFL